MECVEKHLGAASVIASEVYEGYAYRLRLLGHLYEAQEESQQWSTLPVPSHSAFLIEVHEFTDENTMPNSTEPLPHVRPLIAWNSVDNTCAYKVHHSVFDSGETETLLATVPAVIPRPTWHRRLDLFLN